MVAGSKHMPLNISLGYVQEFGGVTGVSHTWFTSIFGQMQTGSNVTHASFTIV